MDELKDELDEKLDRLLSDDQSLSEYTYGVFES